ncbi:MAG TPA: sigma-54 dependent transcriptional regulator [Pyrinomonadaceae bacterium]|nr:sigma-54 dependent transcriptional regulator [Pyrinomonadaceae bacterium]
MLLLRDILSNVKKDLPALVIDDEPQVRNFVADVLLSSGWKVETAGSAEEAYEMLTAQQWLLIFCDVMLGEADGYEILRNFSKFQDEARFVMMTGHGSAVGALEATAIGAFDYLVKPFSVDDILNISKIVREQHQLRQQDGKSKKQKTELGYTSDIPLIGRSPKFVECLKMVGRVAATSLPVLITGESGTGKEVVARAIHQRSDRAKGPFVAVNCGAVPVDLIESELFGHVRGSFTGADRERIGLWEEANGGTILLDEITETSPLFQVKLLRALQQSEIRRVGSNKTIKVDVRVIAATNRDIEEEVKENRFRQDLMYRLNAVTIQLPPLRDRIEDIPLLAEHFASQVYTSSGRIPAFSPSALEVLQKYNWQGNVRELENAVLHAVSMADDIIYPENLPMRIQTFVESHPPHSQFSHSGENQHSQNHFEPMTLAEMEERFVSSVLEHTGGNKQAAARILNIDRKTLARIVKRTESETE